MFKKEIYSLLLFSFGLLFTCCGESATDDEEKDNNGQGSVSVETNYLPIADPYVMFYNNKYYAYGTGGTTAGEGFACFSSDDLKNWKREGRLYLQPILMVHGVFGHRRSITLSLRRSFICSIQQKNIFA